MPAKTHRHALTAHRHFCDVQWKPTVLTYSKFTLAVTVNDVSVNTFHVTWELPYWATVELTSMDSFGTKYKCPEQREVSLFRN